MVSHFLSVLDRLADPALLQFVKHLQSRAQGEVGSNRQPSYGEERTKKEARRGSTASSGERLLRCTFVLP